MKEFKKGQTYFAARKDGSVTVTVWGGSSYDRFRVRHGLAFHTRAEAEAKAEELTRPDKIAPVYPKKMLVWDTDFDPGPYGKLERTVLGTLRGRYITVEHFGTVLEAAGRAGAATVSFYCHAEDIPETLEDYLAEIELPEGAAEKIVELAKKMKL